MPKSDHIKKGDTWVTLERDCPECGEALKTNYTINECTDCEYWKLVLEQ